MSQDQLGQAINYSAALVGRVEVGERMPSPDLARRCDDVLATGGLFAHLRQSMDSDMHAYPTWFREFVEREREATSIREFKRWPFQGCCRRRTTPGRCSGPEGQPIAMRRSASKSRRGWSGSGSWIGPSRRCCGPSSTRACCAGRSAVRVFRDQFAHLAKSAGTLECVPGHAVLGGGARRAARRVHLAWPADGRDIAYTESVESARLIEQPDEVAAFNLAFDLIRAVALSPKHH